MEMTDLDRLTEPPLPGNYCRQFSSTDPRSKTPAAPDWFAKRGDLPLRRRDLPDWFANRDAGNPQGEEIIDGRRWYVFADAKGPGCLVRVWSANPSGKLRIYVDDLTSPAIEAAFADLLAGKVEPFRPPFAGIRSRGCNFNFPIPYQSRLLVVCDRRGPFYHIGHRIYPQGTEVEPFSFGAVDPSVVQLPDGKIRMYFFGSEVVRGDPARAPGDHVIYSALSEDGVHFVVEEGERFQARHITDPEVVKAGDEWLMFLSRGPETLLARSKDGSNFEQDTTFHLRLGGVPGAVVLPNGKVRIFACSRRGIVSALFDPKSEYAVNVEPNARIPRGDFGLVADPAPILRSDGTHYLIFKTRPREMGSPPPQQPGERPPERRMPFAQPQEPGQDRERRLPGTGRRGPWENDLMIAWSKDGLHFETRPEVFVPRAHVPTVTQDATGQIIALFQWFPLEPAESFDRIAASFSSDGGKTWTKPKIINITGIPGKAVRPCDPALVLLPDGKLRLYFTCDLLDGKGPVCLSALSRDGLRYECEPGVRFSAEGGVLDPAVVRIGDKWHYYAPGRHGSKGNYHAVSSDGLEFKRAEDIVLDSFRMLGSAVEVEGGGRFYDGPRSAFSPDGYRWTIDPGARVPGPDPGITRLEHGRYLMVYGILRRERRPGPTSAVCSDE